MFASIDRMGVDPPKLIALGALGAAFTGMIIWLSLGDVLGGIIWEFDAVCSALVFYVVVSIPRRVIEARKVSQSREAVFLASVAAASSRVIGSRNRTVFLLRSREGEIEEALEDARRAICLGTRADAATASAASKLVSYSASNVVLGIGQRRDVIPEGGEENQGLEASNQMAAETKLPVYMTVSFFTPIMLLLYAVFSHLSAPLQLAELVLLEVVILDLAFYLCS